jgi:hypothetical protein
MSCIILIQTCEAFNINVLFPFVVFMLEDLGVADEAVGYYSGAMAASFCIAQFMSSTFWGRFSDTHGRKNTLIIGIFGSIVTAAAFGFSSSVTMAYASRFCFGLLNGNIGVMKSYLTEITDDSNRAKAFSFLPLSWGLGCTVAPIVGGMLYKPNERFPEHFSSDSVFARYPYLLPITVGILMQGLVFILIIGCMENDRLGSAVPKVKETGVKRRRGKGAKRKSAKYSALGGGQTEDPQTASENPLHANEKEGRVDPGWEKGKRVIYTASGGASERVTVEKVHREDVELYYTIHMPSTGRERQTTLAKLREDPDASCDESEGEGEGEGPKISVWCKRVPLLACSCYAMMALFQVYYTLPIHSSYAHL